MREKTFTLFRNDLEAEFLSRPNRFLVIAQAGDREILCHCPNSGRMGEILLPKTPLILEDPLGSGGRGAGRRKTSHTLVGARYRGGIVPLHAGRSAAAAGALVLPRLFPGARELRPEYSLGGSRFDFYAEDAQGDTHLVEVKSCTLVEYGVALFPDASSERALKHLEELAALSQQGWKTHILFLVSQGEPEVFIPNLHSHPAFAASLSKNQDQVSYHGSLTRTDEEGSCRFVRDLPVDLSHGDLAAADSGSYLILLELSRRERITVGSLGERDFLPGWYLYAGSATRGLAARMARHLRRTRKTRHWHLDYLRERATSVKAFPIASYRNLECALASSLGEIGGQPSPRFGSSDCRCPSHLYYFEDHPEKNPLFMDLLARFRHQEALKRDF